MVLSRRNALIGLGTIVGGAGVVAATGAFDTVEAQRSFELDVAGDGAALLGLGVGDSVIAELDAGGAGGSEILAISLQEDEVSAEGLNEAARTGFSNAFTITNNGSQDVHVSIEFEDLPTAAVDFVIEADELVNLSSDVDLTEESATFEPAETASVDVYVDTTEAGGYVEPDNGPHQMTITALSDDAQ